jgi:hypothetical protein
MKQQEILKKIGNILKELNEQYEYLQAEEAHTNDLELELFAANAKFLTDHTEILRKINAQILNAPLTLPEHTQTAELEEKSAPIVEEKDSYNFVQPIADFPLTPLAESAINYEPQAEPIAEPEPEIDQSHQEATQEHFYPYTENVSEPEISIEPAAAHDSYDFIRHEPQIGNDHHSFSISSHTQEEETPPHVDLSRIEPEQAEPVQVYYPIAEPEENIDADKTAQEPVVYANETHTPEIIQLPEPEPAPTEPQPVPYVEPVEKSYSFTEEIKAPEPHTFEQVTSNYEPPVTEVPKAEPEQPLTLNERLSAQLRPNASVSSPVQQTQAAITDIKAAISLNDKMLYVKDLFNGYSLAYSEAIELLNRCKSFDEADRFLKSNYVGKNQWADKPSTVDKFYAVLHRRFTA